MEHAKSEQECLEFRELVRLGLGEMFFTEFTESSSNVRFKIFWSLICYLESILEYRFWNNFLHW